MVDGDVPSKTFESINPGYNSVFKPGRLSIGLVVPIENYSTTAQPRMDDHLQRVQLADQLGFSALWLRDVPFDVPSFGDAGQLFDPFVYLGHLAAATRRIALGVASIILPLRHPAHVAKAAASADVLSGGRLILGVASGDRPEEFPAMNVSFSDRGERFRDSFAYIRNVLQPAARFDNPLGSPSYGMDMLPKPVGGKFPMLITGGSQQSPDWIAENGDGWMTYPRSVAAQEQIIRDWRDRSVAAGSIEKPVMQPLYFDLLDQAHAGASNLHLGFRSGINVLIEYLTALENAGVNHVALNLRFNQQPVDHTLEYLAEHLLPVFSSSD